MDRHMEEVIVSQHKMSGKKMDSFPYNLLNFYMNQLAEIENSIFNQPNIELLRIDYQEAISSPQQIVEKVSRFFKELNLDEKEMLKVIEPRLHRNKMSEFNN